MKEAVYSHSINNMLTELQPHRRFYILLRYLHLIHRRKFQPFSLSCKYSKKIINLKQKYSCTCLHLMAPFAIYYSHYMIQKILIIIKIRAFWHLLFMHLFLRNQNVHVSVPIVRGQDPSVHFNVSSLRIMQTDWNYHTTTPYVGIGQNAVI